MNRFTCILILCVVGCLHQGVAGVYYVTVETESYDENGDGVLEGVLVFLMFKDRELEPVVFYDAECKVVLSVYSGGELMYENEVLFDSSELVGRRGGILVTGEEVGCEYGDIIVIVTIEGRGEFRSEKKNVKFS